MSIGIAEQCSLQCAKHGLLNLLLLIPFMAHSASPDLPTALAESLDELAALVHRLLIRSPEAFWSEQTVEVGASLGRFTPRACRAFFAQWGSFFPPSPRRRLWRNSLT